MEAVCGKRTVSFAPHICFNNGNCRLGVFPFGYDAILHRHAQGNVRRSSIFRRADRILSQNVWLGTAYINRCGNACKELAQQLPGQTQKQSPAQFCAELGARLPGAGIAGVFLYGAFKFHI